MHAVVLYGVCLKDMSYPFSELDDHRDSNHPYVKVFGGGNNEGGAFVGVELLELARGYRVESLKLEEVVRLVNDPESQKERAQFDAWWDKEGKLEFGEEADGEPSLLVVVDSD